MPFASICQLPNSSSLFKLNKYCLEALKALNSLFFIIFHPIKVLPYLLLFEDMMIILDEKEIWLSEGENHVYSNKSNF